MSELPIPNPGVLVEGDMPTMSGKALPSMPPVPDRKLVPSAALAPTKMRKVRTATGLTAREYHVLRILDAYGWCTPEMVWHIANFHRCTLVGKRQGGLPSALAAARTPGLVVSRKLNEGTRTIAYAATQDGMAYIRGCGDGLLCDTNTQKDPASILHFVELNRIMLQAS